MDYNQALAYINDKDKFGSRLGLSSISRLLQLLDRPQDGVKFIHIAGTNGKGSTSSYMATCLQEAGYNVGLFTSPFLERFNERIQLNGQDIPDQDLARITALVRDAANKMLEEGMEHPTTFEIVTAIAFVYFKEVNLDYVVLEVGLGGRFDSTNVIDQALLSVITTIDIDHVNELGDSLDKIAYQKAGIIKEAGLVVSYPQKEEVKQVIEEVADEMSAQVFISGQAQVKEESEYGSTFDFQYGQTSLKDLKISLLGQYQVKNAALALTGLLILRDRGLIEISDEEIYRGLEKTQWKGRLEVLRRNPVFLIDGAHNLQGIRNLAKALELFEYEKLILGVGILKDKDVDSMLEKLIPLADKIVATEVNMPRKLDAYEMAKKLEKYEKEVYVEKDIKKAILKTFELANPNDLIVFGGSLYLIGEVRTIVNLL